MAKKKNERPPPNLQPQYIYTKELKEKEPKKSKKKNAPDRPQPAWLFPPDEENPVLNPTPKSEEQMRKDKEEHDASIEFLHRKSVTAPMKAAPPGLLISLVGGFLSTYGLDSASRLFTAQLQGRNKLGDWKVEVGQKVPKGYPDLLRIFNDFQRRWELEHEDDTSSSYDDSDSGSDSDDGSKAKTSKKKPRAAKPIKKEEDDTSSSDSSSDGGSAELQPSTADTSPTKVTSSSSESGPEAKVKPETTSSPAKPNVTADASNSHSSSTSSDSDSDPGPQPTTTASTTEQKSTVRNNSDSSATLERPSPPKASEPDPSASSSSDSSSDSESGAQISPAATLSYTDAEEKGSNKRKLSPSPPSADNTKKHKKTTERFQRVATDTTVDPKFASNAYQSYDYADKAHQDLIVTKGRGFTKEKNKKKRGAYRGGAIDVSGGKGVRFE